MAMDFNKAILTHSRWKTRLQDHISGGEPVNLEAVGKDDQCELGMWIHGEGKKYQNLGFLCRSESQTCELPRCGRSRPLCAQNANRSESCKFRARGLLLVIIPNWLEVGFRNPPTEHPD